jgi:hypothetical protein
VRLGTLCVWLCIWPGLVGRAQQPEQPARQPEYGGPVILSRGGRPPAGASGDLIRLQPFATLAGVYDTGLTGLLTDEQGRLPRDQAYGVLASFGALGYHSWKHTVLGMTYEGTARHYNRKSYYDGLDQSLALNLSHQASRRVRFELNASAASRRRGFYGMSGYSMYNPEFLAAAEDQLFDTRTHLFTGTGRMVLQKSARLSFGMGGAALVAEPHSRALARVRGAYANGDVAYRLGRFHTVGAAYEFTHFWFPNAFGEAFLHGATAQYAAQLNARWTLTVAGGGYRVETERLRRVAIDPAIAAIIGQGTGVEAFHRIGYMPAIRAGLDGRFRRSSVSFSYARGISPGNGLYLTSARESAGVAVGYTGTRRLHLSAQAGYSRLASLSQTLGRYRNYHAGAGMTYRLKNPLSLFARVDGRKYNLGGTGFGRLYWRATLGLAFSPGEFPLALW